MPDAGDDATSPAPDASLPDADEPDALEPDGGDAAPDAEPATDSGEPSCDCPLQECHVTTCLDLVCGYAVEPDGTPCALGGGACVDGDCVVGPTACGEPVTSPLVVASRPRGTDVPTGGAPAAGVDGAGNLLFVWTAEIGGALAVLARRFTASGEPIDCADSPLSIAEGIELGWDTEATVVGLAGGGHCVVWTSPTEDGDLGAIAYRTVGASGSLGTIRVANEETAYHQHEPAIAALGEGFVIAWTDESGLSIDDELSGVRARRFAADGTARGREIVVPDETSGDQRQPAIAAAGGTFVVTWTDAGPILLGIPSVHARRFAGDSALDAVDLTLSSGHGASARAAALESGDFVVAWESRALDARSDVVSRVVHASGDPLMGTSESGVAGAMGVVEHQPSVSAFGGDAYLVAWHEGEGDRDVGLASVGATLPPEAAMLEEHLRLDGLERDVSLARSGDAVWVTWSDDGAAGDPDAYRSVLAYRLPFGGAP